jgi:hypothetical protein
LAVDHVNVLQAIPFAHYTQPPPPAAHRPPELFAIDRLRLGTFLNDLWGGVALAPGRLAGQGGGATPINIVLGDFLRTAGIIRVTNRSNARHRHRGILAGADRSLFFTSVKNKTSFDVPPLTPHPAVQYVIEWARVPNSTETAAMQAIGVNPGSCSALAVTLPADTLLPADARACTITDR